MPIARILTPFPEDAVALSGYLEALGYTVEISAPGEPRGTAADMEIDLGRCPASAALARAEELARNAGADVYLAPGIFAATAQRAETGAHPQAPPTAPSISNQQPPAASISHEQPAGPPSQPAVIKSEPPAAIASQPEVPAPVAPASAPQAEQPAAPREFAFLGSYRPNAPQRSDEHRAEFTPGIAASVSAFIAGAVQSASLTLAELNWKLAERREQKRAQRELAREARPQLLAERAAQATAAATERQAALRRQREAQLAAAAARAREEAEQRRRAEAEARARAQAELQTRAQAGTRERSAVIAEAARSQAAHRSLPAPAPADREFAAPAVYARRRLRSASSQTRTLVAAAAIAIVVMVGWTIALQNQPTSALPSFSNSTLEQELPFGPVKLVPQKDGKTAPRSTTPKPRPVATPANKAAVLPQSSVPPSQQAAAKKSSAGTKPRGARTARHRTPRDTDIADDEVIVRHYGPTATPKPLASKSGPRHISDID
jgi:hypothetical protein